MGKLARPFSRSANDEAICTQDNPLHTCFLVYCLYFIYIYNYNCIHLLGWNDCSSKFSMFIRDPTFITIEGCVCSLCCVGFQ